MKKIYSLLMLLVLSVVVGQSVQALTYTVTVPEETHKVYLVGDMTGWSFNTEMTRVDATTFTLELPDATETQTYKYWCGPGWDYEEVDADGNTLAENRTWTAQDTVAGWKLLFVPNQRTVTLEVWSEMTVYELYVVGNFNGWSGLFTDEYKMTYEGEEDGGKVFTVQIITDDVPGLEFKFTAGPDWAFEQKSADNRRFVPNEGEPDKMSFIILAEEFKEIYDPSKAGVITVNATVPAGTQEVWIQGSLFGWNWDNPDAMKMTKNNDGTFTYVTSRPYQVFEYRLYNGTDWGFAEAEDDGAGGLKEKSNRRVSFVDDGNTVNIEVWKWMNDASAIPSVSNDHFKYYSENSTIIVNGALNKVELYDMTGRRIQSVQTGGNFVSGTLQKGIYLLAVDGITNKVIVK